MEGSDGECSQSGIRHQGGPAAGPAQRAPPGDHLAASRRQSDHPAAIANLSATGFLAEIPKGAALPKYFEVDLPNAWPRKVQVVWTSGMLAGCNFTTPLSKADLSAARLKSNFREQEASKSGPTFSIGPSDPIWDMLNEAAASEKLPLRHRILLIGAAGATPCFLLGVLAALLA